MEGISQVKEVGVLGRNTRGWGGGGKQNGRKECPYPSYAATKHKGSLGYPATTARCRQSTRRVIKSHVGPLESCACQLARTIYHETFRVNKYSPNRWYILRVKEEIAERLVLRI